MVVVMVEHIILEVHQAVAVEEQVQKVVLQVAEVQELQVKAIMVAMVLTIKVVAVEAVAEVQAHKAELVMVKAQAEMAEMELHLQ